MLNGAVFGLQSSAGLDPESCSPRQHDLTSSSSSVSNLLALDTDSDLVMGDMNKEVLLAVHIAANASKVRNQADASIRPMEITEI